jgi:hypothetical protein
VIIFPETVVPYWTPATDQFWKPTLDCLRSEGKTILVGALVPDRDRNPAAFQQIDFAKEIAALKSGAVPLAPAIHAQTAGLETGGSYRNEVVVRGSDVATFQQRVPVPISMWNPFSRSGAPLNLHGSGVLQLRRERVALLICYEQVLVWPVLASMSQHPTVLIAIANDYWAASTPIRRFQLSAVRAWSRLFTVPYLSAVNI